MKGLGVFGLQAVPTLQCRSSLSISHFCLTGLGGDGNGNSRSQPRQGTDLNGRSPSPSETSEKPTPVHNPKLQAVPLEHKRASHNPSLSRAFRGSSGGTQRTLGSIPSLCAPWTGCTGVALPSSCTSLRRDSPAMELGRVTSARSSYISQPADGRGNSVPPIAQVAARASREFPSTHTA